MSLDNASDSDDASDTYDAVIDDLEINGEEEPEVPAAAVAVGAATTPDPDLDKESDAPSDDEEVEDTGVVDIDGNPRDEDGDDGNGNDDDDDPVLVVDPQRARENITSSSYYREIHITPRELRITSDIMTLFEYSEIIGIRSLQIEKGSPIFTDAGTLTSPSDIAMKELFDRKCPLMVIRSTGRFESEEFSVNEMGFPADMRSSF